MTNSKKIFTAVGPGILVAATGIGAGDLATATFTGTKLGVAVLWVVLLGAFFKFILNEGLTRWQLVTGSTFLEGAMHHLGRPGQYIFLHRHVFPPDILQDTSLDDSQGEVGYGPNRVFLWRNRIDQAI